MRLLAKIGIALVGTVGVLAAVVAVRTATYRAPAAVDAAQVSLAAALPLDFDRCLGPGGRLIPSRILLECARRPAAIPALLRLRTVTRQAARRLASALVQVLKAWWALA